MTLKLSDSELIGLAADCGIFEKDPSSKIACSLKGASYVSYPVNVDNPKITNHGEGIHGLHMMSLAIAAQGSLNQIRKINKMRKKLKN